MVRDFGSFPENTVPDPGDPLHAEQDAAEPCQALGATFLCPLQLLAPAIDWLDYLSYALAPLELTDTEPVVVYGDTYLQQVSDLINDTDRRWGSFIFLAVAPMAGAHFGLISVLES